VQLHLAYLGTAFVVAVIGVISGMLLLQNAHPMISDAPVYCGR
jgi:hypothetical protein